MKKLLLIWIALILLISTACVSDTEDYLGGEQAHDYETILNRPIFEEIKNGLFDSLDEKEVYLYSEEVKGDFVAVMPESNLIPSELVVMLEEAFYQSCNDISTTRSVPDGPYLDTLNSLGASESKLDLDTMYALFPELHDHEGEINDIYDANHILAGDSCINLLRVGTESEANYILVHKGGGSNGFVVVSYCRWINGAFKEISRFDAQNNGYGVVISYFGDFYYVFLQYDYNLKNYDSVRVYKIGENMETENVLIQYLPKSYAWKNACKVQEGLEDYIKVLEDELTPEYLSAVLAEEGLRRFNGDEVADSDFPLADKYKRYYRVDFANIGIPVYIKKTYHYPSDYRTTLGMRNKFYVFDTENDSAIELESLGIGGHRDFGVQELVQLWFKEMDDKILTCCIYHISDYSYALHIVLVEGKKITKIRTDIICPEREFILTEGGRVYWG